MRVCLRPDDKVEKTIYIGNGPAKSLKDKALRYGCALIDHDPRPMK